MRTRQVLLVLLMVMTPLTVEAAHGAVQSPTPNDPALSTPGPSERVPSFAEVRADPNAHQGRSITLGGEVLSVRQYRETTQIEVLQLPLSRTQEPLLDRAASQGRFLAFHTNGLDPKTLRPRDRKSTRLNSSHSRASRMPSSA